MTRRFVRNRDAQCNTGNDLKLEIKFHFEHCSVDIFMLFCIVFHSFCIVKNVLRQFIILLLGEHLFCHFHSNCNHRLFPLHTFITTAFYIHVYTCIIHVLSILLTTQQGRKNPGPIAWGKFFALGQMKIDVLTSSGL